MRSSLSEKIQRGVILAYRRMLEEKSRNDESIYVSRDGKIIQLKAREVLEELKRKGDL
jgi:hypothetical protein